MSRPTKGLEHVDSLDGDAGSKERLEAVLETIAGMRTVDSACEKLAISPARFHDLRRSALEGALAALAPKPAGRPRAPGESADVARLRAENSSLKCELEAARIREEIRIVMPHVLQPRIDPEKKGSRANRDGRHAT